MKNPTLLFNCSTKLDAYYLKNSIQRITCIPVKIVKEKSKIHIIVEKIHVRKAKVILQNQQHFLPSVLFSKVIKREKITLSTSQPKPSFIKLKKRKFYLQMEVLLNNLSIYNLHLIN